MRRIFWKRVISGMQLMEGYRIPRGWGISYVKWEADFTVIHPIPLNYIVAAARWMLFKLSVPWFVDKEKERLGDKYLSGWHDGWDEHKEYIESLEKERWEEFVRETEEKIEEIIQREHEETKHLNETNKPDGL